MSEFEKFTDKGGHYVTTKTASVTMNHHGSVNFPSSVREPVLGNANYVEYLINTHDMLLGFDTYSEKENAPSHAYKISGDPSDSGAAEVERVLATFGKRPPEEHTMFELQDENGVPCIDVSELPDIEDHD